MSPGLHRVTSVGGAGMITGGGDSWYAHPFRGGKAEAGYPGSGGGAPAGAVWFGFHLALCSAPLALALAGPRPPGQDFRTELAVALGFLALAVICLQLLLTARSAASRRSSEATSSTPSTATSRSPCSHSSPRTRCCSGSRRSGRRPSPVWTSSACRPSPATASTRQSVSHCSRPPPSAGGGAHILAVTPVGHPGIRFSPGQFALVTLFSSPFADTEHTFSFSGSAERPARLESTIKALGDFRRVPDLAPGDRLYVDGPFGAISADRRPRAAGYAFIVGGIGVTPAMSHLRTFADRGERRPLVMVCANNDREAVTFREEIEGLRGRLNLRVVHVLAHPPEGWASERGFVTEELLRRHLPLAAEGWEVFICGPPPMMDAVERSLWRLGYPAGRLHAERFDLV